MTKWKLGLIVNPVAGLGGRVGLKGSDGLDIQRRARELGAQPQSLNRAAEALRRLQFLRDDLEILTYPVEMGEDAASGLGFDLAVIGAIRQGHTTAQDTLSAAREMRTLDANLILFAGGDGTARDIHDAVGETLPALGIPAGVKIHSAVYAVNPASAGDLAARYLRGEITTLRRAEVMDLDEDAYRQGIVAPRLYGYLNVPYQRSLVQGKKSPSPLGEQAALDAIAQDVIDQAPPGWLTIVGPGTTTCPILTRLGLEKTLIGVDVIRGGELVASDANEAALLSLLADHRARIVVTPIGGQGYLFGRGNQPISPEVIRQVGRENILVVATLDKILAFEGQPLRVDTGDPEVDQMLGGYVKVITGYGERLVYRVSAGLR